MPITGHSSLLDVQKAVTTALSNAGAFNSICAGPFDPAPTNQAFPYAAYGQHVEAAWYQFQKASKQVDFVIHIYSQQPSFTEAMNILEAICEVIEGKSLTLTSGNFTNVAVILIDARKIEPQDGITREIESRWKIWNNAN